jgi:hypothetical protein
MKCFPRVSLTLLLLFGLSAAGTLRADSLTANFNIPIPSNAPSDQGTLSLTLNPNGSISGTLDSLFPIVAFAFNNAGDGSSAHDTVTLAGLPNGYAQSYLTTSIGGFGEDIYNVLAFQQSQNFSPTEVSSFSFTVTEAGGFSSVDQLANLSFDVPVGATGADFFLASKPFFLDGDFFTAADVSSAVPDPSELALLALGLAALALAALAFQNFSLGALRRFRARNAVST